PPMLAGRIRLGIAGFAWRQRDVERSRVTALEALDIFREIGSRNGEAWALSNLAIVAEIEEEFEESYSLAEQAGRVFTEIGHQRGALAQIHNRGLSAMHAGDLDRARPLLEESLAGAQRFDSDQHVGNALCDLGVLALYERRYEDALELFAASLESAL